MDIEEPSTLLLQRKILAKLYETLDSSWGQQNNRQEAILK